MLKNGRYANSSREKYRRFCRVPVQRKGTNRSLDGDLGSYGHLPQYPFESCIPHSGRDHQVSIKWGAGDREYASVAFKVGFWRINQSQIDRLSCLELKSRRSVEVKSHGAFGNLFALREYAFVDGHTISPYLMQNCQEVNGTNRTLDAAYGESLSTEKKVTKQMAAGQG